LPNLIYPKNYLKLLSLFPLISMILKD